MKRNRKIISILLTLSLLVTLLLPLATPAAAAGLTNNYVDKEVNIADNLATGTFGSLYIKEDSDFGDALPDPASGTPAQVTLTLVDGVEFPATTVSLADYIDAAATTDTVEANMTVISQSSTSVTFAVYDSALTASQMKFVFNALEIDGSFSGAVKVRVDSMDSAVTSGEYTIGNVMGAECSATAVNKKDVSVGATDQKLGTIRVTENAEGALTDGGQIIITLPDDYDWAGVLTTVDLGGSLAAMVKPITSADIDGEELTLNIDRDLLAGFTGRGLLDITPIVDVPYDAEAGDIEVTVEGDNDLDMNSVDLVLGKAEDFGTSISIDKVKNIFAGQFDKELGEITIECDADDSLNDSRYITLELSSNAKFIYSYAEDNVTGYVAKTQAAKAVDSNLSVTDVSDNELVLKTDSNMSGVDELTIDKLKIATSLGSTGDVTIKFGGNAGVEGELVVAKINAPVTGSVENATEVKIGVQGQAVGDVLVKETAKEAMAEEATDKDGKDITPTILLKAPDGVSFSSRPTAEVVEGDVELKSDNLVKLGDADNDGLYDNVYVEISNESKTPSTVKFSNIKLNVNRSFPEGPITLKVGGTALSDLSSQSMFNASNAAYVTVASVVTPAPQEGAGSGMFVIGQGFYNLNGQMKMMDVAPYIKGDRTYVPVRYLAYVCGLTDQDIAWDDATQTVTLTKGDKVVKLVIGSKTLTVGEETTEMDVAPEISNGRTMLPARYVAEAFGGVVTWNAATQAVGIDF